MGPPIPGSNRRGRPRQRTREIETGPIASFQARGFLSDPDATGHAGNGARHMTSLANRLHIRGLILKFQHDECRFESIRRRIFLEEPTSAGEYTNKRPPAETAA
jgi:hypothetical protein